jgi:hypothetical protein
LPHRDSKHPGGSHHLGTLHAIAMCNGAELTAGLTTDVSIPAGRRWIPIEMNVRYLAKATTDVLVECNGQALDWSVVEDTAVPVTVSGRRGKMSVACRSRCASHRKIERARIGDAACPTSREPPANGRPSGRPRNAARALLAPFCFALCRRISQRI